MHFLDPNDLALFAPDLTRDMAYELISDVESQAQVEAPCLADSGFPDEYSSAVRSILRQAVLRWYRAGVAADGAIGSSTLTAGPFQQTTSYSPSFAGQGRLLPGEIQKLQKICRLVSGSSRGRKAFTILPTPRPS